MHNKRSGRIPDNLFIAAILGEEVKGDQNVFPRWFEFHTESWISFIIVKGSQIFHLVPTLEELLILCSIPRHWKFEELCFFMMAPEREKPWSRSGSHFGNEQKESALRIMVAQPPAGWPARVAMTSAEFGAEAGCPFLELVSWTSASQFHESMWCPRRHIFVAWLLRGDSPRGLVMVCSLSCLPLISYLFI